MFGTKRNNTASLIAESRAVLSVLTSLVGNLNQVNERLSEEVDIQLAIATKAKINADDMENEIKGNIKVVSNITKILS